MIIDGKAISKKIDNKSLKKIIELKKMNIVPTLAVILVGINAQSKIYINMKQKRCKSLGIECDVYELPYNTIHHAHL